MTPPNDSAAPLLTIAVPTYNRVDLLRQTLGVLLPQVTDEVEVIVYNNCSTDETAACLASLGGAGAQLRTVNQPRNVGADRNMIDCLTGGSARFIWMLCDDDLPASNAVASLLAAIHEHGPLALYYLNTHCSDKNVSDYSAGPVATGWGVYDRDAFARKVGAWVTFGSSMVVRRDMLDRPFIERQVGTGLIPAAVILSSAGRGNRVAVSDEPLIFVRGGNTGGYDAYTVFTKDLRAVLTQARAYGYRRRSLRAVYRATLRDVLPYVASAFRPHPGSLHNVFRYSFLYPELYRYVVPALIDAKLGIRAALRPMRRRLRPLKVFLAGRLGRRQPSPAPERHRG